MKIKSEDKINLHNRSKRFILISFIISILFGLFAAGCINDAIAPAPGLTTAEKKTQDERFHIIDDDFAVIQYEYEIKAYYSNGCNISCS